MNTLKSEKKFKLIQILSVGLSVIVVLLIMASFFGLVPRLLNSNRAGGSAYVSEGILELLNSDNTSRRIVKGEKIVMQRGSIVTLSENEATLILPGGFLTLLIAPNTNPNMTMVELVQDGLAEAPNNTLIELLQGNIIIQPAERRLYQNVKLVINAAGLAMTISDEIVGFKYDYENQILTVDCFFGDCLLQNRNQNSTQIPGGYSYKIDLNSEQSSLTTIDLNSYPEESLSSFLSRQILGHILSTISATENVPSEPTNTPSPTRTSTSLWTLTPTLTPTPTATSTPSPSATPTLTNTNTVTATGGAQPTEMKTRGPDATSESPVETEQPTLPPPPTEKPTLPPPVTIPPTLPPPITSSPNNN